MKKILLFLFLSITVAAQSADSIKELRTITNEAFLPGEKLEYRIHYGFMDAGIATLEVKNETKKIGPRECYRVVGTGRSVGAFDWFFKVRDHYESIIDKQAIVPWLFIRRIDEGGYTKNQNVVFDHYHNSTRSEKDTIEIPDYTQDLISAFYYARTIDFSKATPGDVFLINGYLDDEVIPLNIKFLGKDRIKTKQGWVRCIKFRPMLQEGRVFKEQEDMTVWVSDDKNKIPVRVQTDILVGSIKMDLMKYENLANELALEKK